MDEIAREWFLKALELKIGEEMYIPCSSVRDARKMITALGRCKQLWMKFDPNKALAITAGLAVRHNAPWVRVVVKQEMPDAVYVKGSDGVTRSVPIDNLMSDRQRKIKVMLEDGLTREEIEQMLGGLSEMELLKYFKGTR